MRGFHGYGYNDGYYSHYYGDGLSIFTIILYPIFLAISALVMIFYWIHSGNKIEKETKNESKEYYRSEVIKKVPSLEERIINFNGKLSEKTLNDKFLMKKRQMLKSRSNKEKLIDFYIENYYKLNIVDKKEIEERIGV